MWYSNVTKGTLGRPAAEGEVIKLDERYFGLLGLGRDCGCADTFYQVSGVMALRSKVGNIRSSIAEQVMRGLFEANIIEA